MTYYKTMLCENVGPDKSTFVMLLRVCALSNEKIMGESFHCQIIKMGFEFDLVLQTGLLNFYSKVGNLEFAKRVFVEMPERDAVAHNVMISALGKHGFVSDAKKLFDEMPGKNLFSWNSMISGYCKLGDINAARSTFDCNPVKDVVSWNTMIDGYCKLGKLTIARELFDSMGSVKNTVTWNTMITGYVQCRDFHRAISTFHEMQAENVRPDDVTMISLLSASAHLGALDMGNWIYAYIRCRNIRINVVLGNALIDMFCKCGSIEAALSVFHGLSVKNIFCWNSIILGLGSFGYGEEAMTAFADMKKDGIKPDGVTFVGLFEWV
ncbi:hypothetical protein IFM89_000698 [Coptis chinensis]|uniref:Pentatricopeptide repeat-containing protein n=1 Tax=Coptis chinensis TaxID=261450 RepID=A0A835H935_9MAGN|nr:hypothetical protein IFM89_000698 [Coptis chinensis]